MRHHRWTSGPSQGSNLRQSPMQFKAKSSDLSKGIVRPRKGRLQGQAISWSHSPTPGVSHKSREEVNTPSDSVKDCRSSCRPIQSPNTGPFCACRGYQSFLICPCTHPRG
jgi:hypothetical protein